MTRFTSTTDMAGSANAGQAHDALAVAGAQRGGAASFRALFDRQQAFFATDATKSYA